MKFLILLFITINLFGFGLSEEQYYKAKNGDGKSADALCSWFSVFTEGQILDKNGKPLDTSYTTISSFCLTGAKQGFKDSQYNIGMRLAEVNSKSTKQEALMWLEKSAEQGNVEAYGMLGEMYGAHDYIPRNYNKSFYWYKKSAEEGKALSQCQLGLLYANGQGTLKDFSKAKYWVQKGFDNSKHDMVRNLCSNIWEHYQLQYK